ncbi:MAG: hypothetical protein IKQ10_04715 [Oscillospiraceae bacterium]|nr:hypothetical protein [Oscillospiraceae bacterium]
MNEKWDKVFGEVPASFEERMVSTLASLEDRKIRRFRMPGSALIAAALLIAILGGTALATDLFGLKSLTVSDPYATPETTSVSIALQGVPDSPEFLANARWQDYLSQQDLGSVARSSVRSGSYAFYSVYNDEMAAALESIAAEYRLSLHTSQKNFYSEEEFCRLLDTKPFISNCAALSGYVYEDGSFEVSGSNVAGKIYEYQFGRYRKGSFSEVTMNIGNADEYTEWIYTTACGVDVQLSMGPDLCVLLADLDDCFVAVNLLGGTAGNSLFMSDPVTKADLEAFADMFDLTALK